MTVFHASPPAPGVAFAMHGRAIRLIRIVRSLAPAQVLSASGITPACELTPSAELALAAIRNSVGGGACAWPHSMV
jgi:hypothetical protein